jgi:ribulose bisphosphate carboxylase small subunit
MWMTSQKALKLILKTMLQVKHESIKQIKEAIPTGYIITTEYQCVPSDRKIDSEYLLNSKYEIHPEE